jgi:hypothetical protein
MSTKRSAADFDNTEGFKQIPDMALGRDAKKLPATAGLTAQPELASDAKVGANAPSQLVPVAVDERTFRAIGNVDQSNAFAPKVPSVAAASPDKPEPIHEQLPQKIAKVPAKLSGIKEHTPT